VSRSFNALALLVYFLWELLKSNLRVAYEVITPRRHITPGIVAVPLDVKSDGGIMLLACLITLTPGALSIEVSADGRFLYVHSMYVESAQKQKDDIKQGFERRVLKVVGQ